MKILYQILIFCVLCLSAGIFLGAACLEQESTVNYSCLLFDDNFQPSLKLQKLLEVVGMGPLHSTEPAILQINDWCQKNLLRQGERWQEQAYRFEELKPQLVPLLSDLGFVNGSDPHFEDYEGALLHGGLLSRICFRLQYLIEQWEQGVRFSHLFFLGGERPLEAHLENRDILLAISTFKIKEWQEPAEFPKTECELMQLIWELAEVSEEMRQVVRVHFINAPMKQDPQSLKQLRPTTEDTVHCWLDSQPPSGAYLAVTNAPYIPRQDIVIKFMTSNDYIFDTVGAAATEKEKVFIFVDELARCIFQIKKVFLDSQFPQKKLT